MPTEMKLILTPRGVATVLAALRMWQSAAPNQPADLLIIATDEGRFKPTTNAQIDDLCERLNFD